MNAKFACNGKLFKDPQAAIDEQLASESAENQWCGEPITQADGSPLTEEQQTMLERRAY